MRLFIAFLETSARDAAHGFRMLGRSPAFAATAVLSLALGIGANTAVFSIVNALMVRPLPVRDPGALVHLTPGGGRTTWTNPLWEQIRDRPQLFDGVFAWSSRELDLAVGGLREPADSLWVSGTFFDALGIPPLLGRTIDATDDVRGGGRGGPVALISYAFWQRRFGGATDIVGRPLSLERVTFTIVGVTPPGFSGPTAGRSFDVAIPIASSPLIIGRDRLGERSWWWLTVMARLKPGQAPNQAAAAIAGFQPDMRAATMPSNLRAEDAGRYLTDRIEVRQAPQGPSAIRRTYERPLLVLLGVVGLVLLLACVNVSNLMLVRGQGRRQEIGVRLALGASRRRLVRQLLTEHLVPCALGLILALAFAQWASRGIVRQFSSNANPVFLDLSLDWTVLAFSATLAVAASLLFGIFPAFLSTGVLPASALDRRRATDRGWQVGRLVAGAQVAICLVLVVTSGLFLRTFISLAQRSTGFDAGRVLVIDVDARRSPSPPAQRTILYDRMMSEVGSLPGVAAAALSALTPISNNEWDTVIENPAGVSLPEQARVVRQNLVSPDWFSVYGIPFVAGRGFTRADMTPDSAAAIVNETFAARYFPGGSAVGRAIREAGGSDERSPALTIVGVVRDSVYLSLREEPSAVFYRPVTPGPSVALSVRASVGAPAALGPSIAAAIASVDRDLSLTIRPLAADVSSSIARERLLALLSGFFGAIGLLLAGVGLYGVVSHIVAARRAEIGIRMALGAMPKGIVGMVVRGTAISVCGGLAAGTLASVWAARFVSSLLYGVDERDPTTLTLAIVGLMAVAIAASWIPARRAARTDPAEVLRQG